MNSSPLSLSAVKFELQINTALKRLEMPTKHVASKHFL